MYKECKGVGKIAHWQIDFLENMKCLTVRLFVSQLILLSSITWNGFHLVDAKNVMGSIYYRSFYVERKKIVELNTFKSEWWVSCRVLQTEVKFKL